VGGKVARIDHFEGEKVSSRLRRFCATGQSGEVGGTAGLRDRHWRRWERTRRQLNAALTARKPGRCCSRRVFDQTPGLAESRRNVSALVQLGGGEAKRVAAVDHRLDPASQENLL